MMKILKKVVLSSALLSLPFISHAEVMLRAGGSVGYTASAGKGEAFFDPTRTVPGDEKTGDVSLGGAINADVSFAVLTSISPKFFWGARGRVGMDFNNSTGKMTSLQNTMNGFYFEHRLKRPFQAALELVGGFKVLPSLELTAHISGVLAQNALSVKDSNGDEATYKKISKGKAGFGLGAGVNYAITKNLRLGLGYQLTYFGKIDTGDINKIPASTGGAGSFIYKIDQKLMYQDIRLGLTYEF